MTTTATASEPNENDRAVIQAASDVIESEQEKVRVEILMMKAIRTGMLLNQWRKLMVEGGFTEEWVEHAAMDLFHTLFPLPETQEGEGYGEPHDEGDYD